MTLQTQLRSLSVRSQLLRPGIQSSQSIFKHQVARQLTTRPARNSAAAAVSTASDIQQSTANESAFGSTLCENLNPPASTRPASLILPIKEANASRPAHLYKLAKAYLVFYKNGLKAIRANQRLVGKLPRADKDASKQSRAAVLLRERTRHDVFRLPLFGLIILLTGEFSPLVAYLFPKLTPLTCRIPTHVDRMRRIAEQRRTYSYQVLQQLPENKISGKAANGHIARVLGLGSRGWDKVGLTVPLASKKANDAVQKIVQDDFRIKLGGGVNKLDGEEVIIAAESRGLDVRARSVADLRIWLEYWIRQCTEGTEEEGRVEVRRLLLEPREKTDST